MKGAIVMAALTLGGCSTVKQDVAPISGARYCEIAKTISWSTLDTRLTKEQIDRANRTYRRLCQAKK